MNVQCCNGNDLRLEWFRLRITAVLTPEAEDKPYWSVTTVWHCNILDKLGQDYVSGCPGSWDPFYWRELTLISAWITNYIHCKVWAEITYQFPNFNGCTAEVWKWISNFVTLYQACNYLSILGLKLNHVNKRGYWSCQVICRHDADWCQINLEDPILKKKKKKNTQHQVMNFYEQ